MGSQRSNAMPETTVSGGLDRSAQDPGGRFEPSLIAISGLLLVVFLALHLGGLLPALVDPPAFERFAAGLHARPWLPVVEIALAGSLLIHPLLALNWAVRNHRARGPVAGPIRSRREGLSEGLAAIAARTLPLSGALLALFLVVHLQQLRLQRPQAGQELSAVLQALHPFWSLVLYVAAGAAAGLHLFHGQESAHRRLGLLDPGNRSTIRQFGRALALLLGVGFAGLPLALVLRH